MCRFMIKLHKEEAQKMFDRGHTFYAISYQLEQWYKKTYTVKQIQKALGGIENNTVGHKN